MIAIRDPKTFYFDFDWPKDVDENLKHEIEFIMKSNESLVENKKKMKLNNYCPNISMEQYSWTRKIVKGINRINMFLTLIWVKGGFNFPDFW